MDLNLNLTPQSVTVAQVAKMIDHSLLRPELTNDETIAGCQLAAQYHVATATVRPCDVPMAVSILEGTNVGISTVVGFPHGDQSTPVKAYEAKWLIDQGADELDMVINIGRLRSGADSEVLADIAAVVNAADGATVKVILENSYLSNPEKLRGCRLSEEAGAGFVKTATGFASGGATFEDLRLMRGAVSSHIQLKAAGGVRDLDKLLAMASIGVTRFGCTATAAILDDLAQRQAEAGLLAKV